MTVGQMVAQQIPHTRMVVPVPLSPTTIAPSPAAAPPVTGLGQPTTPSSGPHLMRSAVVSQEEETTEGTTEVPTQLMEVKQDTPTEVLAQL